jgi:hypothetical protein
MMRFAFALPPLGVMLLWISPAKAQFIWGNAITQTHETQQQQTDADPTRAGDGRIPAQQDGATRDSGIGTHNDYTPYMIPTGDALDGTNSPSYKLTNGSTITVSGRFTPDPKQAIITSIQRNNGQTN